MNIIGNKFVLNDSTGKIIVDADLRWWHNIHLSVIGELGNPTKKVVPGVEFCSLGYTEDSSSLGILNTNEV